MCWGTLRRAYDSAKPYSTLNRSEDGTRNDPLDAGKGNADISSCFSQTEEISNCYGSLSATGQDQCWGCKIQRKNLGRSLEKTVQSTVASHVSWMQQLCLLLVRTRHLSTGKRNCSFLVRGFYVPKCRQKWKRTALTWASELNWTLISHVIGLLLLLSQFASLDSGIIPVINGSLLQLEKKTKKPC